MTDPNRYRDPLSGEAQADLDTQLPFSGMPNADGVAVPQQEQKENSDIKALHHAEAQMYDEQQEQDDGADQLAAMRRASSITPEYAAYCDKLSADLDVPFNAVAHDKEAARKEADVPAWQQIAKFAPKTSALLQEKPEVFHQVQDDAAALKDLEVFKSELKKNGVTDDEYNAATKTIFDPAESIKAELNKSLETGTPYVMPSRQNSAFFTNLDALGTQFNESAIQSDIGMRSLFNDMQESLGVISPDEALANRDNLTREYKDSALRSSEATPNFEHTLFPKTNSLVFGAASSLVQSAPVMAVGLLNPLAGVLVAGAQTTTTAYPKYSSRGGSKAEALLGAGTEGLIEVVTEKIPLGFAAEHLGKMSIKNFAKQFLGKEMIGEQLATFGQDLTDTLVANPNKTMAQFWDERPEAMVQTLFAVGMNTAAMASVQHIANTAMKYDGSYEANQKLNQEMEIVKKLKVAGLNTVRAKQILDNMDGDSAPDVYVDPQQLFNQGQISPQQFKNAMPNYSTQLDEALAVGGLLRMDKNELMLAMRNDEEGWASLSQHLKVDPAADSLYESTQSMDALTDELNKLADKRIAESKDEAEARDKWEALKEKARQRLADSGMDKEAIEQAATMDASVAHAFSTRTGLDAGDILSEQFGRVSRRLSSGEILGGVFNQYAGEQALNADMTALQRAKQSVESGADPEQVRQETGWHKWEDGKWRFEIEAMDTGSRAGMSAEDRRASRPYISQGIPDDQVIVRNGGGEVRFNQKDIDNSAGNKASIDTQPDQGVHSNGEVTNHANSSIYAANRAEIESGLEQWTQAFNLDGRGSYGVVPQQWAKPSAYSDVRRGEGSFLTEESSPETIRDESNKLIAAAKENGFFWENDSPVFDQLADAARPTEAGAEHDAYFVGSGDDRLVIRSTANGTYGPTKDTSPAQYLQRLEENNIVFPYLPIEVIAVSQDEDGNAVIWTAQKFADGKEFDSEKELESAMERQGWEREGVSYRYKHKETGAVIQDAHTGNVLYNGDDLFPIDVIVEKLPNKGTAFFQSQNAKPFDGKEVAKTKLPEGATHIDVDGVSHPALNSNGQPIHWSEEGTRNFWRWFGDSKAVDTDGRPLVLYHGPSTDFTVFDPDKGKGKTADTGVHLTTSEDVARTYSKQAPMVLYLKASAPVEVQANGAAWSRLGAKVKLSAPKGKTKAVKGTLSKLFPKEFLYDDFFSTDDLSRWTRSEGFDSIVFHDIVDRGPVGANATARASEPADLWVTFKGGSNIKSATDNSGAFDGSNPNFLHQNKQDPRGTFDPVTRAITLMPDSDLSTYLHESGHLYLEVMASLAAHETASEGLRADMDAALKWFGVKGENAIERLAAWNAMTLEEKRNFHEKWAESFEQYLFEGVAPSPELREAFKNFRQWLTHVYKSMAQFLVGQKNAKLNDEMRGVFDRILASEEQINTMREARNMLPLFTVRPANITNDEWERYQKAAKDFVEKSIEQLTSRGLRDMKWLSNAKNKTLRKLQMEAAQARRESRMEARTAVLGQPVYRAWQFLTAPVEGVVARNKQARSSEHVDTARDSLFTAIAKLGGLNKEEAVSQYGIDPKDFLRKGGVFGKPVLRVDGGLSPDAMAEALAQHNYLPLDEHGKWDILDLEDLLREEAAGNPQYSTDVDMDVLLGEPQRAFFDAENVEYMGGRLNRIDIRNMFDDIQLAEMAGIDPYTGEAVATESPQGSDISSNTFQQNKKKKNKDTDLFVAHNLSEENLIHADELGGLAAPSLGISRTTTGGFDGYGEITLLADPSITQTRDARTFNADVYSPRHPRAVYKIDSKKLDEIYDGLDAMPGRFTYADADEVQRYGAEALAKSDAMKLLYLKEIGKDPKLKKAKVSDAVKKAAKLGLKRRWDFEDSEAFQKIAAEYWQADLDKYIAAITESGGGQERIDKAKAAFYGDDGKIGRHLIGRLASEVATYIERDGVDVAALSADISKQFRTKAQNDAYSQWVEQTVAPALKEKRIKVSPSKTIPYTLDNIVSMMTRELRGGEGFNYGAGNIRAMNAQEIKSIQELKNRRGEIVSSKEMEELKKESQDRLMETMEQLKPFYKYDANGWGYYNDASSAIAEGPRGWGSAFKINKQSESIIKGYISYLKNLPTEYFETKMQRAVGIGEFKTAVVPKGISAKAMAILEKNGLNVVTYDPKKEGSRTAVIAKQEDILFQKKGKDSKPKNRTLESMGVLSDDGIHPDLLADYFGFPSVEAMVKALLTAPDPLSEINRLTDEIMVQRYADLATPQAIEQAALAALHSDAHSKFLATELAILNRAVGKPRLVMQAAKQYADRIVSALRIADLNPAQYEMQAAKAGKETEKLLGQNKTADAAMAKRNQILHDATARRVREEKESVAKALRFFDRTEKAARNGKLRADVGAQVLTLLDTYDLRKGTTLKAAELADRSLAEFVQQQSEAMDMPMPSLADAVLRGGVKRSYKTMSVEEFNGLVDAVKYLEAVGRREYAMYKAVRDQSFAQERSAILDRLREYWPDAFDEEGNPLPTENAILKTGAYNTKKKARSAVHELLTPETVTNILEGGEFGQVHDSLFARLSNAMTDRSILMKELHEKLQPFMDAYTWKERREFGKKDIGTAAIGEPLSRENALVAALLAGSKEGRDRLANYGWNDARIAQVVNLLDAKDIALANAIFDMFDNTLWPKLEALNKRTMGVSPPKVLPIALQAKNGTLTGGYFPIRYDGDMDARSSSFDDKQALDLMKNGIGLSAKTNQSSSQARGDGVKMRPLLSLSVMSRVAGETAHDISLREAVMDSARLLNNAEIAQGIQNIVGMEGWKSLKKNLGDIASPPHDAGGMFAGAANFARRNVVTALMSGVGTAVQNFTGLLPAFSRVHKGLLLKEIADVPHLIEKYKDTIEKSAYMRERFGQFERDLVHDVDKLGMKKGVMPDQSVWFAMMAWVDRAVSVPVWQAAYREGSAKGVDAVEYADHIVRQTQGGGRLIDRAPIMRGGALQQLFTMFYSYFNGQLNLVARDAALAKREVAQGEVSKAAARLAASAIFVWILPAVVSELTRQAPDDEDDEDKLKRVVRATILYPTAMIPLLRDFAPFVYDKIAGNRAFDPRLTPVQGFVSTLSRAATAAGDIGSDDFDEKDFKALMMGVGFTFNLPAILFTDVVLGTKALLDGETGDIRAPLIGTAPSR